MRLRTRHAIAVAGGKILTVKARQRAGSSVEVRQLFFNLPARRKFLRARKRARAFNIISRWRRWRFRGAFTFHKVGRLVWQTAGGAGPDDSAPARQAALASAAGALRDESRFLAVDFSPRSDEGEASRPNSEEGGRILISGSGVSRGAGVSRATLEDQHRL
jgi:hypothetical protein